ncbi:MAG: 16S rRNA (cytidine(1402)-2'-O)-methyltransferase [Opitutales bacterium]
MPAADVSIATGCLHVVATPIGNRGDVSERAREILQHADAIACEDTRVTGRLLASLDLPKRPLIACQEHNEKQRAPELATRLENGETLALVSDSGTPAISDPGFRLVRECRRRGIKVVPVPGPVAAIAALSISGLPSDRFTFVGFVPPKSGGRRRLLEDFQTRTETLICYESPHRIERFLSNIVEVLGGERCICVARELTKHFESSHSGPAREVHTKVLAEPIKGEFVVCIANQAYTL